MMDWLKGKKTYVVAGITILVAGAAALYGEPLMGISPSDSGQMILEALMVMFLRKGIADK